MERARIRPQEMSLDEYLVREERSEVRHEFHASPGDPQRGEALAMSGSTEGHNLLITNLVVLLHAELRRGPCRIMSQDMRVFAPGSPNPEASDRGGGKFFYPDVVVRCEEGRFADQDRPQRPAKKTTLLNPSAIFEVLSESTGLYDRTTKFNAYWNTPSLKVYVLLHQDWPVVETFHRGSDGAWAMHGFRGRPAGDDEAVPLPTLDVRLPFAELYEGIELTEPADVDDERLRGV